MNKMKQFLIKNLIFTWGGGGGAMALPVFSRQSQGGDLWNDYHKKGSVSFRLIFLATARPRILRVIRVSRSRISSEAEAQLS